MSSSIWTRCAGGSEIRPLRATPWRAVESQHQVSTRKLVATSAEQELLEELIDAAKPPAPPGMGMHYLLSTPFRYPPLRHGSRFGTRNERGIWYGSEARATAFAEVAYYRFVFLAGTSADLGDVTTELSVFRVQARAKRGVDLSRAPFDRYRRAIASPVQYSDTQALGAAMRAAGVELARYPSARDASGGVNIAVFSPRVFGRAKPRDFEPWHCIASRERVELAKRGYFGRETLLFERGQFEVDGTLPAPAV
jgi:hypothetical protein